jgi:glycogen debranching enzyme
LVAPYFTALKNGSSAANNGWIGDYDSLKNFAANEEHHYLRRTIVIWGDLVKLRYGNSKRDSPNLWKRMKKYIQSFSQIFNGIRIDNAHSTPLNVGEYLMRKAR